jgi:uncharacterized Ntn-hydrolase superfamily protein
VDEKTLERAKARIAEAASGRVAPAQLEAALERTRAQVEALAAATAELEGTLPEKITAAVHDGLRAGCSRSGAISPRFAACSTR